MARRVGKGIVNGKAVGISGLICEGFLFANEVMKKGIELVVCFEGELEEQFDPYS